jgi:hypothetical protein
MIARKRGQGFIIGFRQWPTERGNLIIKNGSLFNYGYGQTGIAHYDQNDIDGYVQDAIKDDNLLGRAYRHPFILIGVANRIAVRTAFRLPASVALRRASISVANVEASTAAARSSV